MYRYDDYDQTLVNERVEQFRDQVNRRVAGELSEDEFKPLRLMNGLYLQLHGAPLRRPRRPGRHHRGSGSGVGGVTCDYRHLLLSPPRKRGSRGSDEQLPWIPAFAGMTRAM